MKARRFLSFYKQDLRLQYPVGHSGLHVLDEDAVHLAYVSPMSFESLSKVSGAG